MLCCVDVRSPRSDWQLQCDQKVKLGSTLDKFVAKVVAKCVDGHRCSTTGGPTENELETHSFGRSVGFGVNAAQVCCQSIHRQRAVICSVLPSLVRKLCFIFVRCFVSVTQWQICFYINTNQV